MHCGALPPYFIHVLIVTLVEACVGQMTVDAIPEFYTCPKCAGESKAAPKKTGPSKKKPGPKKKKQPARQPVKKSKPVVVPVVSSPLFVMRYLPSFSGGKNP